MDDLIRREDAMQRFSDEVKQSRKDHIHINTIKRLLDDVDVAYNVDKVVEQIAVDEKEIIRKPMERIKKRIDEKMESVDYWTKPFDKYEYYDNGFWEGMNEVATIVKEEGGIE